MFNTKIENTKKLLIESLNTLIQNNFSNLHTFLLETEEIAHIFVGVFIQQFFQYMDDSIEEKILFMGTNVHLSLISFTDSVSNISLQQIKKYISILIELLLNKKSDWKDELRLNYSEYLEYHND